MSFNEWYKLDTAAQIFPIISNRHDSNSFRLACVLKEEIDKEALQNALITTLARFPMFRVRLKKGIFWYYLEQNNNEPLIKEESPYFCQSNKYHLQRDFLFNLSYYGKRIAFEIFHGVTDGTGGMEFFKAIVYHYLINKGYKIENRGEILTDQVEQLVDESQNSFKYNYSKRIKPIPQEKKGYRITGQGYLKKWIGCMQFIIDLDSLKNVTRKYQVTVTEYVGALLLYNTYHQYAKHDPSPYPIRLFIPVNARKYFSSKTLKNFVLFIRTNSKFNGEITFDEVLTHVKETFKEELAKEKMLARLRANVDLEKSWFSRFVPLFIKQFIVKIGYRILGSDVNTMSFSNIGVVNLPSEMYEYIDRLEFSFGASKKLPINASAISCGKILTLSFATTIIERRLEREIAKMLVSDGVKFIVETNDLEV